MRFSYLLAFVFAASLTTLVVAQEEGGDGPPPPPPHGDGPPPHGDGPPPHGDGPPPPPPHGDGPPPPADGPPPSFDAEFNNRRESDGRRRPRIFKAGEQIHIAGGRSCYIRPQCNSEKAKSRFKGKLSGRRLVCHKGKPTAQQTEFIWKAHPCTSPEGRKHHFVRFENGKHKNRFLCLTRKAHKSPKRRYGAHFGILGHRRNGGCAWKVKEAMVYNRRTKRLEKRFVFANRKHRHFILRARRRCPKAPPGARRLFAAQNYIDEARMDTLGTFIIEPVGPPPDTGYDTQ